MVTVTVTQSPVTPDLTAVDAIARNDPTAWPWGRSFCARHALTPRDV
jgi:hypothetical protein